MKVRIVTITFWMIAILLLLINNNINWGPNDWKGALEADAKGYYAYLPATFIYHDFNFSFMKEVEAKYKQTHLNYDYRRKVEGKWVNKYYCGVSIAQSPFFLIAHLISTIDNSQDADGYSKWYMQFISLSAIFYHLLGLLFLIKLLRLYKIKEWVVALGLVVISFGTNLFVYTIVEAGMSHVYSFAFVSIFLYLVKKNIIKTKLQSNSLLALSVAFGLIVIIRPVNGLVLFVIPFTLGSKDSFVKFMGYLRSNYQVLILGLGIVMGIVFIQLCFYFLATGKFLVYSYTNEGFNFLSPHMIDILFSWQKGLFLYTPIYLIGTLSALYFIRKSLYMGISWLIFFLLITYVFSSWWMWFYGGSFSSRVYVEFIPLFILPIALLLNKTTSIVKRNLFVASLLLLTAICQIQSYQYRYYEIHYSEMTQEKYWEVFLLRNRFN